MGLHVKICGIKSPEAIAAAASGGARAVGLVFYPPSPRFVDVDLAAQLARTVPTGVRVIGLFVDADDDFLATMIAQVPLDMLQLHGKETPERVARVRRAYGLPVLKAVRVAGPEDLEPVPAYEAAADWLLFDAKPPANVATLPGGNGLAFDWSILSGRQWSLPWMLSGGLGAGNLEEAVRISGARAVDVSSGVEERPGVKDPALIRTFLETASAL
jgi:phosphoribosylanthranilate isomerase